MIGAKNTMPQFAWRDPSAPRAGCPRHMGAGSANPQPPNDAEPANRPAIKWRGIGLLRCLELRVAQIG
jgi:hypothetical protein